MDFEVLLLALTMFWKVSSAVRCYICDPATDSAMAGIPLCQYFDGSDAFVSDCPHSTVCYKKETSLVGLGDPAKSIKRGCANQLMSGYQEKVNGHWMHVDKIHEHEAYREGCHENSNEFGGPTKTIQCFCRGDLCNHSVRTLGSFIFVTLMLLIVL